MNYAEISPHTFAIEDDGLYALFSEDFIGAGLFVSCAGGLALPPAPVAAGSVPFVPAPNARRVGPTLSFVSMARLPLANSP